MRYLLLHFMIALAVLINVLLFVVHAEAKEKDVVLWLARSCVGEAGWNAHKTNECAALWHVYKKRVPYARKSLYAVTRQYSAATKRYKGRPNRWVLFLNTNLTQPRCWPATAKWQTVKSDWQATLEQASLFVQGKLPDPVPEADHYGSSVDTWRALAAGWVEIKTPFRNKFWKVPGLRRKKKSPP